MSSPSRGTKKNARKQTKPGRITRNPFLNFMRDFRRAHKGMKATDVVKHGAELWRKMSDRQKSPYCIQAKNARKSSKSRRSRKRNTRKRKRGSGAGSSESESSEEEKETKKSKSRGKKRVAKRKKKSSEDSSEEEDIMDGSSDSDSDDEQNEAPKRLDNQGANPVECPQ